MAVLLWTPLICTAPLAVPILAAYCGVFTRFSITLAAFYCKVYPKLSKAVMVSECFKIPYVSAIVQGQGYLGSSLLRVSVVD